MIKEGSIAAGEAIKIIPVIRVAILTVSDKGFSGERADLSGPALADALEGKAFVVVKEIVPDELERIKAKLIEYVDQGLDLVITTWWEQVLRPGMSLLKQPRQSLSVWHPVSGKLFAHRA